MATWRRHDDEVTTTWQRRDKDMATTSRRCHVAAIHRRHNAATLPPHCCHNGCHNWMWRQCGGNVAATWRRCGGNVAAVWRQCGSDVSRQRGIVAMSSPCRCHVVVMSSSCCRGVVVMSSLCRHPVLAMSSPCCRRVVVLVWLLRCLQFEGAHKQRPLGLWDWTRPKHGST